MCEADKLILWSNCLSRTTPDLKLGGGMFGPRPVRSLIASDRIVPKQWDVVEVPADGLRFQGAEDDPAICPFKSHVLSRSGLACSGAEPTTEQSRKSIRSRAVPLRDTDSSLFKRALVFHVVSNEPQ